MMIANRVEPGAREELFYKQRLSLFLSAMVYRSWS
jgi:hypothetical protein